MLKALGLVTLFLLFVFTVQRVKHWKRSLIKGGCGVSVLGNNQILTRHGRKQPPTAGAALRLEWIISTSPFQFQPLHDFVVMISLSAEVNSQQLMAETSVCEGTRGTQDVQLFGY